MTYHAYNRMGAAVVGPSEAAMKELLASLDPSDAEHPDVSLTHESGWCVSIFASGLAVLENVESGEGPWHMEGVSSRTALDLWRQLASGEVEQLKGLRWVPGYGPGA